MSIVEGKKRSFVKITYKDNEKFANMQNFVYLCSQNQ